MTGRWRHLIAVFPLGALLGACALLPAGDSGPSPEPAVRAGPQETDGIFESVEGSGNVEIEQREVSGFDRVSVSGVADLFIEVAGSESLSVEAEDNLLPFLVSEVSGRTLRLGTRANTSISAHRPIVFRLKVTELSRIEAAGSGLVDASGLDTDALDVETSGTVKAVAAGRADVLSVKLAGTSSFDGRDLRGRRARVEADGTATAVINVTERLDARASGTAAVRYLADPEVTRNVSGLGKVEPL